MKCDRREVESPRKAAMYSSRENNVIVSVVLRDTAAKWSFNRQTNTASGRTSFFFNLIQAILHHSSTSLTRMNKRKVLTASSSALVLISSTFSVVRISF